MEQPLAPIHALWPLGSGVSVQITIHGLADDADPTPDQFDKIHAHLAAWSGTSTLAHIRAALTALAQETHAMATALENVQSVIATLTSEVEANNDVVGSAVTLLSGLSAQVTDLQTQLDAAIAAGDPVAIQAAADALAGLGTTLATETQTLADAVAANTPAAPAEPA